MYGSPLRRPAWLALETAGSRGTDVDKVRTHTVNDEVRRAFVNRVNTLFADFYMKR